MAKLKLNPNPTFTRKLTFATDGKEVDEISLKCRHKSRIEFSELWDAHKAAQPPGISVKDDAGNEVTDDAGRVVTEIDVPKTIEWQVDLLMTLVEGWDADAEFNRDNMRTLLNNYFDFYGAFVESYTSGLMRAKLGNSKP